MDFSIHLSTDAILYVCAAFIFIAVIFAYVDVRNSTNRR